jgi:hypothetical protein
MIKEGSPTEEIVLRVDLAQATSALHRLTAGLHRKNVAIARLEFTNSDAPHAVVHARLAPGRVQHVVAFLLREVMVVDVSVDGISPRAEKLPGDRP